MGTGWRRRWGEEPGPPVNGTTSPKILRHNQMDTLTPERRSANMAAIRSKDTGPELAVRRYLHKTGLRYRLHRQNLPGHPDLVFSSRRVCVFVHGCFWHGCPRCVDGQRAVKSNSSYWTAKINANRLRDARHRKALVKSGWKVFTIWECDVSDVGKLAALATKISRVRARSG